MEAKRILAVSHSHDLIPLLAQNGYAVEHIRPDRDSLLRALRDSSYDAIVLDCFRIAGCDLLVLVKAPPHTQMVSAGERDWLSSLPASPDAPDVRIGGVSYQVRALTRASLYGGALQPGRESKSRYRQEPLSPAVQQQISTLLVELGIPVHLQGYTYLKDAISLALMDNRYLHKMTSLLYPTIACRNQTTWQRVERSIRNAIIRAFEQKNERLSELFAPIISRQNRRATCSEFIARVCEDMIISGYSP